MSRALRVVCYVPSFNAGDTTRGVEIVKALVERGRAEGRQIDATFVCPPVAGPNFESFIRDAGFEIAYTAVPLTDDHVRDFMTADRTGAEFVPEYERAKLYIEKYIESMRGLRPDLVIYGCMPPAGIAAQILGLNTVRFLPFPAHDAWLKNHLLKDVPDEIESAFTLSLPAPVRRWIVRLASRLALSKPFVTQPTLARAGRDLGWREPHPNLFTMLRGDVELVTDLPDFYADQETGPRARITGPLFARPRDAEIDSRILTVFKPENPNKVFVTMGSSGTKDFLLNAIEALTKDNFNAVVVVQPTICSLADVRQRIRIPDRVYLTDAFVPAHQITPLADVAVIHGGQGTVQTTLGSGTPFLGVSTQAEQQANLDNAAQTGAGIRLPRCRWKPATIRGYVSQILTNDTYKKAATQVAQRHSLANGPLNAANEIWDFVRDIGL